MVTRVGDSKIEETRNALNKLAGIRQRKGLPARIGRWEKNNTEVGLTETAYWNVKYTELFLCKEKMCSIFNTVISHGIQKTEMLWKAVKSALSFKEAEYWGLYEKETEKFTLFLSITPQIFLWDPF